MTIKEVLFGSDRFTENQENIRELAMYPFAGIFTALANFLSFLIMDLILVKTIDITVIGHDYDLSLVIKQLVSWIATIITAYTTNRIFVFRSHGHFFIELMGFAAARLSTFLLIEVALFYFMVYWTKDHLGLDQKDVLFSMIGFNCTCLYVIKILNNCVLVTLNFIMSKWLVFRASGKGKSVRKGKENVVR